MTVRGEFDDLDEFLNDRRKNGGGGAGLVKWRKRKPPILDTVMSKTRKPVALLRHGLPGLVTFTPKDGDGEESHIYTDRVGCLEDPDTIENQNRRDRKTGERESPPDKCPVCKLIEWVRAEVMDERLSHVDPLFVFSAADDDEDTIVHAAGFAGLYTDKLDLEKKKELRVAKILLTEAWKEKAATKKDYLFCICDYDDPSKGLQKAIETGLLGEKVMDVIGDARESLGPDKGNPFKNPYVIRWKHLPNEQIFNQKYSAIRMENLEITKEILDVISSEPPPVDQETAYMNVDEVRTSLEKNCVVKNVPWDKFFKGKKAPSPSASSSAAKPRSKKEETAKDPKNPLGLDETSDDTCGCECPVADGSKELCGGFMRVTDSVCPVCKAEYDLASNPVKISKRPWDPKKPTFVLPPSGPKKRSEAKATPAVEKTESTAEGEEPFPF